MLPDVARVVLILPTATYRAATFLEAAAALGVDVVVATDHVQPLAATDEEHALVVDLDRPQAAATAIAALARREPVDAVVAVDDGGVLTAAHAAEALGLVHNPPDAVAATRDKAVQRAVLTAWGLPQPLFRVVRPDDDVGALAEKVGLPCVVKPLSLSASTGVIRADTAAAAAAAATRTRRILADHDRPADEPLLVEQFLPGVEVALEGLLRGGRLDVLALFDKPDPLDGPYFAETYYVTPSRLAAHVQGAVEQTVERACRALGLREGPVHAEARVQFAEHGDDPVVVVLEVASRSIGGRCSRVLQFGTGVSLEEVILRHALGHGPVEPQPQPQRQPEAGASGVLMVPTERSGVLVEVGGVAEAAAVAGVVGVEITATVGRPVQALPEGGRYLGFVFARGSSPAAVERSLRRAHAALRVRIDDRSSDHEEGADVAPRRDGSTLMPVPVHISVAGDRGDHR